MKIRFKKLIIKNFLSFEDAVIHLENKGYTLIKGTNNSTQDNALSNGSGKSSIFSALCFALTGETIQGLSTNLNNLYTEGDMQVTLTFSIDNDNYEITRSRTFKGKSDLKVIINGEDKSGKGIRESEAILEEYLPTLKSDLIGEVILIGQGMPHKFSNHKPAERKELLEVLSNSTVMLEDIRSRIETRLSNLNIIKETLNGKVIQLTSEKALLEDSLLKYNNKLEELKQTDVLTLNSKLKDIKEQIKNLDIELKDLEDLIESNKNSNSDLNLKLDTLNETYNSNRDNLKSEFDKNSGEREIIALESEIKSLNKEITEKKEIKDVCPYCGQKIPHIHKPNIEPLLEQLSTLNSSLENSKKVYDTKLNEYNNAIQRLRNNFDIQKTELQKKLNESNAYINTLNSNLKETNDKKNKLLLDMNNLERDIEFYDKQCEEVLKDIEETKNNIEAKSSKLLYNIREQENNQAHIDVVNKMTTLIKRDFRGILLTNVINYINSKCKEYCKEIFHNECVEFALNGNDISITYLNKPLEALSGGEQQKIDLILQFAIRSMMQEYTGFTSNILVLDEILDNLDAKGCDEILNFITTKLNDIESIFIISHHADSLNICNDNLIRVEKNEKGISRLYES